MLIEFNVENYRSIRDRATLSMKASTDTALEVSNVFEAASLKVLRSAVLYGANASGKTNFLYALAFVRQMVLTSSRESQVNEAINVEPFRLSTLSADKPSTFEIIFASDGVVYRYGLMIDQKRIHAEWLFDKSTKRETYLFKREAQEITVNEARFKEGKGLQERTRNNALFLSVCAQFNGKIASNLIGWFQNMVILPGFQSTMYADTLTILNDEKRKRHVLELIQTADPTIFDFTLQQEALKSEDLPNDIPDELKQMMVKDKALISELMTSHRKFDDTYADAGAEVFSAEQHESGGTQKLITLAGPILDTLRHGRVLVVDELDARMHPLLTQKIISLFNSHLNRANAQLIFTTHDATLLSSENFRRDQIWFTEKDRYGATDLYALDHIKGVRNNAVFAKDYMLGKYGAIPFVSKSRPFIDEVDNGETLAP